MPLGLQNIIDKIIPVLEKYQVKKASIFGSFARGEENKDSDIDILVELGKIGGLFALVQLKRDLEEVLKRKVDLLTYRSVHRFIRKYVKQDEIKIYGQR